MLKQHLKGKVEGKTEDEEEHMEHCLPEDLNNSDDDPDDFSYHGPSYKDPVSTLDNYPELVKKVQTQTLQPDLIIESFRRGLDTNILNLYASKLSVHNIENIAMPFLERNPQITELRIDGNNIGDEGARLLATNQNIKKLDVSVNNITDIGVIALCQNNNIVCLHVGFNNFTERAMEVLANNPALLELHFSFEQFQKNIDKGALKFFLKNDNLNILHCLGGDGITADIINNFWKELIEQRKLRDQSRKRAFLMGCHSRLGENSPILNLYKRGGKNILSEIFSYIKPKPCRMDGL
jgi:Leucine-rich repeat (LRR) protein